MTARAIVMLDLSLEGDRNGLEAAMRVLADPTALRGRLELLLRVV